MNDVLARILAYKREEVAARKRGRPHGEIERAAAAQAPARGFLNALETTRDRPALIAETKKASPSKGLIRGDFDAAALARAYAAGGAVCLSVLTDAPSFHGHEDYLVAARAAAPLPVLRKDFMVDCWQIAESRALGADAVLIIMAAVDDECAADLADAAHAYGMDALVEVHDETELERAVALDAHLIGINNRSLVTFETDLAVTERLAPRVPSDRLIVSESGVFTAADIARLTRAGAHAFLVGESLMRQTDVAAATRELLAR